MSSSQAGRLAASLVADARQAVWFLFVNRIAASVFTPRAVRHVVYRLVGLDVRTPTVEYGCTFTGRRGITIGEGTFVNYGVFFEGEPITIGRECMIGMQAMFVTAHHPPDERGRVTHRAVQRPIVVGDGCWIGARAVILPGVSIAAGCTVAAGAVVAVDLVEPGLYGGVPARLLRPT
jgi:maltose O-acetyltransferase